MKNKELLLFCLSIFSLIFGIIAIDYSIYTGDIGSAFWFCYIALVFLGIGGLLHFPTLVASQFQIVFVPVLIWLYDFSFISTQKNTLWGISDYFLTNLTPLARIISLEHFFIIPLGLAILFFLPKSKHITSIFISTTQIIVTFFTILLFTQPTDNANCVFYSCASVVPNGQYYHLIWFGLMFSMIIIGHMAIRIFYVITK